MNLDLKNRLELIDLATYGSQARKEIHPKVLVSAANSQLFEEGDILDANAVYELLRRYVGQKSDDGADYGYTSIGKFNTQKEFEEQLNRGNINDDAIYVLVEPKKVYTGGVYINFGGDEEKTTIKSVILTQEQYDALVEHDKNTIYFIVENPIGWQFGDKLPIILN